MTTLNSEQLREIRRIYGSNSSVAECREIYESLRRKGLARKSGLARRKPGGRTGHGCVETGMETRGKNVAGGSGVNVVRQSRRSDFRYQIPADSAIPCVPARVRIHLWVCFLHPDPSGAGEVFEGIVLQSGAEKSET